MNENHVTSTHQSDMSGSASPHVAPLPDGRLSVGTGVEEMLGEDEYESLPVSAGFSTFMLAGAAAGIMEHCVMYPLDSVKTRMQSIMPESTCRYRGLRQTFTHISRTEGWLRTVRGVNVVACGAGPAHALYFSCYETTKKAFSRSIGSKTGQSHFSNAAAGACATLVHDGFMNPVEVVKQRMQMACSPYSNVTDCIRRVYSQEGIKAFYRSYATQLIMNVPFQMTHFVCYEGLQETLNPTREYHPMSHAVSGGIAGAIAAAVTTPLDVCKTVLNTQEACVSCNLYTGPAAVKGVTEAATRIYAAKGTWGFFSGLSARVMFQMPATALTWSVYELFKYVLANRRKEVVT